MLEKRTIVIYPQIATAILCSSEIRITSLAKTHGQKSHTYTHTAFSPPKLLNACWLLRYLITQTIPLVVTTTRGFTSSLPPHPITPSLSASVLIYLMIDQKWFPSVSRCASTVISASALPPWSSSFLTSPSCPFPPSPWHADSSVNNMSHGLLAGRQGESGVSDGERGEEEMMHE